MARNPSRALTEFSRFIEERMEANGLSVAEVHAGTGKSYEHIRKVVRGLAPPSVEALTRFSKPLDVPLEELERLDALDRQMKRYGKITTLPSPRPPGMEPIERIWALLTDDQKEDLACLALCCAKRNRKMRAG